MATVFHEGQKAPSIYSNERRRPSKYALRNLSRVLKVETCFTFFIQIKHTE